MTAPVNMTKCRNSGGFVFPRTLEQQAIAEVKTLKDQLASQASELEALKQMVSALLAKNSSQA